MSKTDKFLALWKLTVVESTLSSHLFTVCMCEQKLSLSLFVPFSQQLFLAALWIQYLDFRRILDLLKVVFVFTFSLFFIF